VCDLVSYVIMDSIKPFLAVSAIGLLSLLPIRWAQSLGRWVGRRLAASKTGKSRKITEWNLAWAYPDQPVEERRRLIKSSLEHTGMAITEMGMSWLWKPERTLKQVRSVTGEPILEAALHEGRGVIILAPHIGNWEVLNLYVSQKHDITVLYRPPKMKLLDDLVKKMRARLGTKLAPADLSGVRKVIKTLKSGGTVGILPDQEPDRGSGEFAPFFGHQAYTMKLFPQLIKQTGARVVCGFALRTDIPGLFDIHFTEADPAIYETDQKAALSALNRSVEQCIAYAPDQYQWEYKRYNTPPEGEQKRYR
jgi:KDO2-lipid IV(A) lauroyltransferase